MREYVTLVGTRPGRVLISLYLDHDHKGTENVAFDASTRVHMYRGRQANDTRGSLMIDVGDGAFQGWGSGASAGAAVAGGAVPSLVKCQHQPSAVLPSHYPVEAYNQLHPCSSKHAWSAFLRLPVYLWTPLTLQRLSKYHRSRCS